MSEHESGKKIIDGATLIDGTGKHPIENSVVQITNGKIKFIGQNKNVSPTPDFEFIDGKGKFLLPGLIDVHVHIAHSGFVVKPHKGSQTAYLSMVAFNNIRSALQSGITTLRCVCDEDHIDLALRSAVRDRTILGPNLYVAGKGICMTGGHGSEMPGLMHEVDSPDKVRKAVRMEVKAGVDFIKLLTSHRSDFPEFSLEEISAGVDESHRLGKRVAIHAANFASTRMAAIAGVDSIEHGSFIDEETADIMAAKDIVLVPTIWVKNYIAESAQEMLENYDQKGGSIEIPLDRVEMEETSIWFNRCVDQYPKTFELVRSKGIRMASGTDNVFADEPFAVLHRELEYLVNYGFSNMEVIESATRIGAEVIGIEDQLGTIEVGKSADMIMVDRDPLNDISTLGDVSWVMKGGEVIPLHSEWKRQPIKSPLTIE